MTDTTGTATDDRECLDEFGDVDTAVEMVRGLNDEAGATDEVLRRLQPVFGSEQAVRDVRTGCMTLIMMLGAMIGGPLDFVPTAIRKLRAMEEIPAEVLPMVAGGMTAAFLQMSPNKWRDALGPVSREETLAWVYTTWSLVSFIDYTKVEKGYALRELESLVDQLFADS